MMQIYPYENVEKSKLFFRGVTESGVRDTVSEILRTVRDGGDAALRDYARRFDKAELAEIEVPARDLDAALEAIDPELRRVMEQAAENIRAFHAHQCRTGFEFTRRDGVIMGQKITPIEKVGLYIPGGTAAYPSTVLMNAIPAKLAGCSQIVMVSPPTCGGGIAPVVLAAAKIAGVDRVFQTGGAQAIAALAYGTETVPKVDKIVGPGNAFVAEAKRQVFGLVNIDMIAGPSEILVVADGAADPAWVAADLLSQAEHDKMATAVLVTDSPALAEGVQAEVERQLARLPRQEIAQGIHRRKRQDHPGKRPGRRHRDRQRVGPGASGAVHRGPDAISAPDPQRRVRLPGPLLPGGAGRLYGGPQPHPAHQRHGPLFQPSERRRFYQENPIHLFHPGRAGRPLW